MELTIEQIENALLKIKDNNYSPKVVDEVLNKIINDYKEKEIDFTVIDGDMSFISIEMNKTPAQIVIKADFNGELEPGSIRFEGTTEQWKSIKNKSIFEGIPWISCSDGQFGDIRWM